VQEYLNNSDEHLWGIVTNGTLLRLLRDTSRTSRPSYLEFDLQGILDGNRFNEFSLFYRVCHRSRLPKTGEDSTSCWLEKYFQLSIEQGGRVRDKLRDGVEDALKSIGTGLLRHPKNDALRERVRSGALSAHEFHRQLLRLVYRLLFLMVAEERRMIVPEAPDSERRQRLYDAYYSIGRLRNLAEKVVERSTFGDLWLSLQRTFGLFENGDSNPLGIPPLNGDLFSALAVRDLQDTHLYNDHLLESMRRLSLFEEKHLLQRVNYAALDVEELGSVYESLLDLQSVFVDEPEGKKFDLRTGSERKSTGSYYTRPELVRELVESALVPVMQDRLANTKDSDPAKDKEKKQQSILTMSVCDPACGSGHFLLAAARRLGRELAKVRTGEEEPTPKQFHLAVRDVISHCMYGVDVNPLAVDLCKLALWLEGHWTGKPLSFLDHRIKCGNSLVGVLDPAVLKEGIPDDAFTPVTGDDRKVASIFKKTNKEERKGQPSLPFDAANHVHQFAAESVQLLGIVEDTPADVRRKEDIYRQTREQRAWLHDWTAANLWTAAFFVPLTKYDDPLVPTHETFTEYLRHGKDHPQMTGYANALSIERHFFHWRLEFPDVFDKGGFDVVLGNPPWDRIKLQEEEHWADDDYISGAPNKAQRSSRIEEYRSSKDPRKVARVARFDLAKHTAEATSKFVRESRRFGLTAVGDINTYALFAELSTTVINGRGRAGIVIPTGIATDDTCKAFFSKVTQGRNLVSLFDFENRGHLFPALHTKTKFCLFTISSEPINSARFCFLSTHTRDLCDPLQVFPLSAEDLRLMNPNTQTCPLFRTTCDAALTQKVYRRVPVLINERTGANLWSIDYLSMFHMANDSGSFRTEPTSGLLRLYEAKMFWHFDHRWATFDNDVCRDCDPLMKTDPNFVVQPRYWVPEEDVSRRLDSWKQDWLICFRGITDSRNERSLVCTVVPRVAVGHSAPLMFTRVAEIALVPCLLANLNSLILDYIARQKISGMNLSFYMLNQLPVFPPSTYSNEDSAYIGSRVLRLVYTARDVQSFAKDLGHTGGPFAWNDADRSAIRAELDAYFAHLYGLTSDELEYVLGPKQLFGDEFPGETFRVLKDNEESKYGEYRTRRLVLEAFDKLAESPRFRDEMPRRVSAISPETVPNDA